VGPVEINCAPGRTSRYHREVAMTDCCGRDLSPAVALFRSLGDPARLAIVRRLAEGEARVVDLTRQLGLAQSTVSKHLACLRDCRLIDYRTEGRQSFYALTRPELIDLLRSAEFLLAHTADAVALCPVYGDPTDPRMTATAVTRPTGVTT
jgi:ArsR family transcriptional regulator, cadmium/lead-responsive transcriptional repressor